jgi:hypothetical protein
MAVRWLLVLTLTAVAVAGAAVVGATTGAGSQIPVRHPPLVGAVHPVGLRVYHYKTVSGRDAVARCRFGRKHVKCVGVQHGRVIAVWSHRRAIPPEAATRTCIRARFGKRCRFAWSGRISGKTRAWAEQAGTG